MESHLDVLRDLEIFQGLNKDELIEILEKCSRGEASRGDVLLEYGTDGNCLFILLTGMAEVQFMGYQEETYKTLCQLRGGQTVGEMSLLDGDARSARVIVQDDTVFLSITRENLFQVMDSNHKIGYYLMHNLARVVSRRLRYTNLAIRHGMFS